MSKTIMTYSEIITAGTILKEHLHQVQTPEGTSKLFAYDSGWNDNKIAAAVNTRLNTQHIVRLRQSAFGELAPIKNVTSDEIITTRLTVLEQRFNALCDAVGESVLKVLVL